MIMKVKSTTLPLWGDTTRICFNRDDAHGSLSSLRVSRANKSRAHAPTAPTTQPKLRTTQQRRREKRHPCLKGLCSYFADTPAFIALLSSLFNTSPPAPTDALPNLAAYIYSTEVVIRVSCWFPCPCHPCSTHGATYQKMPGSDALIAKAGPGTSQHCCAVCPILLFIF